MTKEDDYKSPWKNKDATVATTLNNVLDDTGYTFLHSYQTDTSDSIKQVETSTDPIKETQTSKEPIKDTRTIKEPIKDTQMIKESIKYDTHIVNIVRY